MTKYILSYADSPDLGGSPLFNKSLVRTGYTSGELDVVLGAGEFLTGNAFTLSQDPGAVIQGDQYLIFRILVVGGSDAVEWKVTFAAVQADGSETTGDQGLSPADNLEENRAHELLWAGGVAWHVGYRLRVKYVFINIDADVGHTVRLAFGDPDDSVVYAPWGTQQRRRAWIF